MHRRFLHIALLAGLLLVAGSCTKQPTDHPNPNAQPATRLWLSPDTSMHESVSRQHLYWYGEDPDGRVVGYLLAIGNFKPAPKTLPFPDTLTYTWVTITDSLVGLPLRTIRDSFTVIVRAVDNTFSEAGRVPEGAVVRMVPQPYWDVDTNGVYNAGDVLLGGLGEAADPKGAILLFPIRNTPPTVQFAANPVDSSVYQQPDTTFTVATFSWVGHDADGDQTITSYRIALNDTTSAGSWFVLNGTASLVTLAVPRSASDGATGTVDASVYTGTYPNLQYKGTVPGMKLDAKNVLYLQAKDIAGEYSPAMKMPSGSSKSWYVKKPRGRMLLVVDYNQRDSNSVLSYYRTILADPSIAGGIFGNCDILNVGTGLTIAEKQVQTANQHYGDLVPQYLNPAFILTLRLYDIVFWYSDLYPAYTPAQIGLFYYTLAGGKVLFSTTFPANISFPDVRALNDFAPIDSVTTDPYSNDTLHTNADNRIPAGTKVLPYDSTSGYPMLTFGNPTTGTIHNFNWRRIYSRADAHYIYRLDTSSQGRYLGKPPIAVIDNAKRFVLFALPLHLLNGDPTASVAFFRKVIVDEFGFQ